MEPEELEAEMIRPEEAMLTAFGDFIRRRRRMVEKTQEMVATLCPNIDRATLARWEGGAVSQRISDARLQELAVALEIDFAVVKFRYTRSTELAAAAQDEPGLLDYFATQNGFDSLIANEDYCPRDELEGALWEGVQLALRNYFLARAR